MKRALDAYRAASDRGASPSELVAAVIGAHEAERAELAGWRMRATLDDLEIVRALARSGTLTAEQSTAVLRAADATAHLMTVALQAPSIGEDEVRVRVDKRHVVECTPGMTIRDAVSSVYGPGFELTRIVCVVSSSAHETLDASALSGLVEARLWGNTRLVTILRGYR